ncbi:MAG TPA: hypothetical protein VFI34_05595 [Candidatus Limnocylindrales bacterium]|nr:hypothetical protein [Candidatus Limnocylindrales bacterium]
MSESLVQVTEGVGKKLHTNQRTIGGNAVEDEYMLPGEFALASYSVSAGTISLATANSHLLEIMAGAANAVRIRRIVATPSAATAVTTARIDILRVTTAGTGGTAVTPRPYDTADAALATAMVLPTAGGVEGVTLRSESCLIGSATLPNSRWWEWSQHPGMKPIIIPAGATNGIVLKNMVAVAGCTVSVTVEFVETAFV